ncbi:hypothetical protein MTO96_035636 [Rhipicephalus appendiculatus]
MSEERTGAVGKELWTGEEAGSRAAGAVRNTGDENAVAGFWVFPQPRESIMGRHDASSAGFRAPTAAVAWIFRSKVCRCNGRGMASQIIELPISEALLGGYSVFTNDAYRTK